MLPSLLPDAEMLKLGVYCLCPRCKTGALYAPGLTLTVRARCTDCDLNFSKSDSADGPAVFLIFILGFFLVPLALLVESLFHWSVWIHTIVWSVVALSLTVGLLRPIKAYIIALQYKHRPGDWS